MHAAINCSFSFERERELIMPCANPLQLHLGYIYCALKNRQLYAVFGIFHYVLSADEH